MINECLERDTKDASPVKSAAEFYRVFCTPRVHTMHDDADGEEGRYCGDHAY